MPAGSKLDRPAWLSCCWRLQKNCSQNLLTMSKTIVSKKLLNKFAHGESWIALHSTCNLRLNSWHDFNLYRNCSKRRKFAQNKEKLLTKIKFAQSTNLLKICSQQKFAYRICLQHRKTAHDEKPCRLGWINTMAECLASSQSEYGWHAPLNGLNCNGWKDPISFTVLTSAPTS